MSMPSRTLFDVDDCWIVRTKVWFEQLPNGRCRGTVTNRNGVVIDTVEDTNQREVERHLREKSLERMPPDVALEIDIAYQSAGK